MCGLAPSAILGAIRYAAGGWEAATIRCLPTGTVQVLTGSTPHGQGHETTWSQIVADRLGYGIDEVEVLHGDTAVVPLGMDTYGSRSLAVGGVALYYAAERIVEKAKKIAAHLMEVDEAQVEHVRGTFQRAGDVADAEGDRVRGVDGAQPARRVWSRGSRRRTSTTRRTSRGRRARTSRSSRSTPRPAPSSCSATSRSTTSARSINPTIVEGQIHGGLAQGVAQALYEEAIYDEDGNLLTGNMVTYLVPSAAEFPRWELHRTETPSPTNPLGVKGVGETGAIASPAAVMNAVVDALAEDGVTDIAMPATPERVWRALEEVRR